MLIQIPLIIGRPADYIDAGFTHIELWASYDEGRNSEEITSSSSSAATLFSDPAANAYQAGGREFSVEVDSTEYIILFDSALEWWTPSQLASKINETVPGLASVPVAPKPLKLTSPTTGRASHLKITSSLLGVPGLYWSPSESSGTMARIALDADTRIYTFTDPIGTSSNIYKWRVSANGSLPYSDFSSWMSGKVPPIIDEANLAIAEVTFANINGNAAVRKILVSTTQISNLNSVSGTYVWDTVPDIYTTDETGYCAIPMVRNSTVLVALDGVPLVKEFVVPDQATFDLLQVMGDAPDLYTIQQPPALLTRRSL